MIQPDCSQPRLDNVEAKHFFTVNINTPQKRRKYFNKTTA
jgi:hypothetical protein